MRERSTSLHADTTSSEPASDETEPSSAKRSWTGDAHNINVRMVKCLGTFGITRHLWLPDSGSTLETLTSSYPLPSRAIAVN